MRSPLKVKGKMMTRTEQKSPVVTPGGRAGNDRSTGSRSNGENWIEQQGGMPRYIRIVRNGLMKHGHSESSATRLAIGAIKRWAAGGGDVSPKVRAAAQKALAEWEAMKKRAHAKGIDLTGMESKAQPKDDQSTSDNDDFNKKHPRGKPGTSQGGKFVKKNSSDSESGEKGKDKKKGILKYTIKKGDTLSELAEEHGTTVEALMKANPGIKDADLIITGENLNIPINDKPGGDPPNGKAKAKAKGDKDSGSDKGGKNDADEEDQSEDVSEKIEQIQQRIRTLRAEIDRLRAGKKSISESEIAELETKVDTLLSSLPDQPTEQKDKPMNLEFKEVGVNGLTVVDAEEGVVETIVSVTGVRDNVKDVIHPGAYEKSLNTRTPKGVWSHAWDTPVSKTLAVKELMPGDAELPSELPDGTPWPAGAGALKVKTQFNLETQRGREAYSDVVFFGDQQEWSIGYQVPVGGARIDSKTGIRHIDYLELYEYSPVLFGAMPAARTSSVKEAQVGFKSITMPTTEFKSWVEDMGLEFKGGDTKPGKEDEPKSKDDDEDVEDDDSENLFDLVEDEDEDDDAEEKGYSLNGVTAYEYETLVKTREAIDHILDNADLYLVGEEEKGAGKTLAGCVEKNADTLGDLAEDLASSAEAFDAAVEAGDGEAINEHGGAVLTIIEDNLEDADSDVATALQQIAKDVASLAPEDVPQDEDDTEKKGPKPLPPKPEKKGLAVEGENMIRVELKELDAMRDRMLANLRR